MLKYKLSVVVPTKNRYNYLEPLVKLIDSFSRDDIEIVIEDNSDDNKDFLPVLNNNSFPALHYFYNPQPISVGENLDNGILHSQGDYVCVIGDDDGVLSSIIPCVEWMERNSIDAVIPMTVSYAWPDHDDDTFKRGGIVRITTDDNKKLVEYLDPDVVLDEAIKNGFLDRGKLPICYHGIVSRKVLDKVYKIGSQFSPGPSPDIAAGVALSLVIDNYALVNYPIIISGASIQHGGGAYRMKHGAAEISDLPFLPKNTLQQWENSLPKVWSVETIWPESAIKALRYMHRQDLIGRINFNKIYFNFLIRRFYYRKRLYEVVDNKISFFIYLLPNFIILAVEFLLRKITPSKIEKRSFIEQDNAPTIIEAAKIISSLYPGSKLFHDGNYK